MTKFLKLKSFILNYRVIQSIRIQRWGQCGDILGLMMSKRPLCVLKIGRKLALGKKCTPVVIIMSQEDGQKMHNSNIWLGKGLVRVRGRSNDSQVVR